MTKMKLRRACVILLILTSILLTLATRELAMNPPDPNSDPLMHLVHTPTPKSLEKSPLNLEVGTLKTKIRIPFQP
jgi:hypothetical protein